MAFAARGALLSARTRGGRTMPGSRKIFINYRHEDGAAHARNIHERLARVFGASGVFMDVDDLLAGMRFDKELEKALARCDLLLAVIGPRWLELLAARAASGERDYVREEIAAALTRGIIVVPVLVDHATLPRAGDLPEEILGLVLHQKHDITHERFGRDMGDLIAAIKAVRKSLRREAGATGRLARTAAAAAVLALIGGAAAYQWVKTPRMDGSDRIAAGGGQGSDVVSGTQRIADAASQKLVDLAQRTPDGALKPGDTFRDCPDCPEMVVIPAGTFTMGSPPGEEGRDKDEGPEHEVRILRPFAAGKFEVTFADWDACVARGGCGGYRPADQGWGRGNRPVLSVSWNDAREYTAWLSRTAGKSYRLLTEAEWEYAARAGTKTPFATGQTITTEQANFDGRYSYGGSAKGPYRAQTTAVGSFRPNAFGLYDMHGNVWEWVEDCYERNYSNAPTDGSAATTATCSTRVLRGGSWYNKPRSLRSALRDWDSPDKRNKVVEVPWGRMMLPGVENVGFRIARTLRP